MSRPTRALLQVLVGLALLASCQALAAYLIGESPAEAWAPVWGLLAWWTAHAVRWGIVLAALVALVWLGSHTCGAHAARRRGPATAGTDERRPPIAASVPVSEPPSGHVPQRRRWPLRGVRTSCMTLRAYQDKRMHRAPFAPDALHLSAAERRAFAETEGA